MSEEKSKQPQPDKKEKGDSYIDEEGNQGVAFTSRIIAEEDVS